MALEENFNFISTKDAAKLTGYTYDYIGQLSRKGYFKSKKIGRKLLVDTEGLLAYKQLGEGSKKSFKVPEVSASATRSEESTVILKEDKKVVVSVSPVESGKVFGESSVPRIPTTYGLALATFGKKLKN